MKANKFFAIALAALTLVGFNACKDKEVEVESISLNQKTLQLAVGETATLVATVAPEGAAKVEWSSDKPAIASVNEGVVEALGEGSAVITAKAGTKTARCIVNVGNAGPQQNFQALLQGTDYFVFALDATSFAKIPSAKIKDDFRINGSYEGEIIPETVTCVLEIWNTDLTDANWPTTTGLNCFGEAEGWIAMNAANCSWGNMCGGLRQVHRTVDLSGVTNDHVLAIVYKTPANNSSSADITFTVYGVNNSSKIEKHVAGNTNGEWTLLEYKMSDLFAAGLDWSTPCAITMDPAFYTLGITVAGAGQGVEVDAVLVYKKAAE
jgi:hypothetical protein